jgi:hypothetical protein
MPPTIGLIVCGNEAFQDFIRFVRTLEVWHPGAHLFIFTNAKTQPLFSKLSPNAKLSLFTTMDAYEMYSRAEMESLTGKTYDSLFTDFTYEKANLVEFMLKNTSTPENGVWLMDSDIIHLAPLPSIPAGASIALSPHYIREADCKLFGKYNAGFMWIKDESWLSLWREAGHTTRFYEQAPLEIVAAEAFKKDTLYEFPIQVNFGWWRMFQSSNPPYKIQALFSIHRADESVGIRFDGAPLQSIHSHWSDQSSSANGAFNKWFNEFIEKMSHFHAPLRKLKKSLSE